MNTHFPAFIQGTNASLLVFILIVIFCTLNMFYFLRSLSSKVFLSYFGFMIGWSILVSLFALSGFTRNAFPFSVPLIFGITFALTVWFSMGEVGRVLCKISPKALILALAFRFPLELVLHSWVQTKTVPETMSWNGSNFDILPGILSFFVVMPFFNKPWFYRLFFVISIGLLLNVMRVVLMSADLFFSWKLENPIQLIFEFPYCLIAVILVPWAFQLNIALGKSLFKDSVGK